MASAAQLAKDAAKQTAQTQKEAVKQNLGEIAERAARGLDQISTKLRTQDVDGLIREAEAFARAQPLAFFGASLAAGFLAMRLLKSPQSGGR